MLLLVWLFKQSLLYSCGSWNHQCYIIGHAEPMLLNAIRVAVVEGTLGM